MLTLLSRAWDHSWIGAVKSSEDLMAALVSSSNAAETGRFIKAEDKNVVEELP